MRFLDTPSRYKICRSRLLRRRKVVVRTLEYLDAERKIVDSNTEWRSPSAQRKRKRLLDEIHAWYDTEVKKIDSVLARLNQPSGRMVKKLKSEARSFI